MKAIFSICVYFCALLLSVTSLDGDNKSLLSSVINLIEMEYVDMCKNRSTATWAELIGTETGLKSRMEQDKAFSAFVNSSLHDIELAFNQHALISTDDRDVLMRKVQLLMRVGDVMLPTEQWVTLVNFADTAQHKLRFSPIEFCGDSTNCSLREFHNSYARQPDEDVRKSMKAAWEKNLPNMTEYVEKILPLLRNASKEYASIEAYWDSLVEYEGALLKARELWEDIQPLYAKLQKYITLRLKGDDAIGQPLDLVLLKSLTGDDWSNAIEGLLPAHPGAYQAVNVNLQLKNLGGLNAYKAASKLIKELNLEEVQPEILSKSLFNSTCPATMVNWCKPNELRVITCKDVSIGNYLDAHETAAKIVYKQTMASYSNNTYVLREAPRYSAIYEAIPGFVSLLALSPHAISRAELFPYEKFSSNDNHHRMVLQLILALRDLPKLNYYLAVDEWRLKVLSGQIDPNDAIEDLKQYSREFSLLETSGVEILADPYVLFNKPFIGKFMGIILKYQIYQSFAEELENDDSDLVKHVASNSNRLSTTMLQGFGVKWPELVSDLLAQRENGLEYTAITDYYRLLDEYLDTHFDPTRRKEDEIDDYLELSENVPPEENDEFDLGENPVVVVVPIKPDNETLNKINIDEPHGKDRPKTTPVPALEVKKGTTTSKPELPKEESYNIYWWIGIGVALAVVVVLIAIIARKRHNHRKELERQRRDNSRA